MRRVRLESAVRARRRPRRPRPADDVPPLEGGTAPSCVYPPGPRHAGIHLRTHPGAFDHMPDDLETDAPDVEEEFEEDADIELDDADIDEDDLEAVVVDDDLVDDDELVGDDVTTDEDEEEEGADKRPRRPAKAEEEGEEDDLEEVDP